MLVLKEAVSVSEDVMLDIQTLYSLQEVTFLARLYNSTESYCCHFDVSVGVSVSITL